MCNSTMAILDGAEGNSEGCKAQSAQRQEMWINDYTKTPLSKETSGRAAFQKPVFYFTKRFINQQPKQKSHQRQIRA